MSHFFAAGSHTRFGPGTSKGRRPSMAAGRRQSLANLPAGVGVGLPPPAAPPGGARSARGLKFSWDDNGAADKESEEWTYKQVNCYATSDLNTYLF